MPIYCQLAWYLHNVSIFGKSRVWNLEQVVTCSLALCAPDNASAILNNSVPGSRSQSLFCCILKPEVSDF